MNKTIGMAMIACACSSAGAAWATNGTQLTGYGSIAQGRSGVSLAYSSDAIAAANNPASMAHVGHRLDLSFQVPLVRAESDFNGLKNKGSAFAMVPEFGYNRPINDRVTLGISTHGSGVAFDYDDQLFTGGPDGTSGSYIASVILPTITYKVNDQLALGFSAALAIQALDVENLPGVANHGTEFAQGLGWRVGALWKPTERLSVGGFYAPEIKMSKLDGYRDDLMGATDGRLSLPEQFGVGVAYQTTDKLKLGLDLMQISWSDTEFNTLFGYRDQYVIRFGGDYQLRPDLVVRGGVSLARRQFAEDYLTNNLLLVGMNTHSISGGFTKTLANGAELSAGAEYAWSDTAEGYGPSTGSTLDTDFMVVSVGYGIKF